MALAKGAVLSWGVPQKLGVRKGDVCKLAAFFDAPQKRARLHFGHSSRYHYKIESSASRLPLIDRMAAAYKCIQPLPLTN